MTTTGTSNTAYRTSRTAGFSFSFSKVRYEATFDVTCAGEYDAVVTYATKPHGTATVTGRDVQIVRKILQPGKHTVNGDIRVNQPDTDYTVESIELRQPCAAVPPGTPDFKLESIHIELSLGLGTKQESAGFLELEAETITSALYTSAALTVATADSGVETIRDTGNLLRQIKAPQALADIVPLDASSYEVRFYWNKDVGAQDSGTKIYAVSGTPYVVYKFENPDSSGATRLKITETRGSDVRVNEYAFNSGTNTWTLSRANGLRKESLAIATAGSDTTKTTTIRENNDTVVTKTTKTYHTYPWGEELTSEVLDPDGAALATTYTFYDNSGTDGTNYGRLKLRTNPDGSWERHTYDASGRTLKTLRPYLNQAPTTDESLCRVTENSYSTPIYSDGDSLAEKQTTTIEKTLGTETGRSYTIEWSKPVMLSGETFARRSDYRCVASGSAWDASTNLVTETLTYTTDPFIGQTRRMLNPDGTMVLTAHVIDGGGQTTTTVKSGATNGTFDDIVTGTITVTNISAYGQVTGSSTTARVDNGSGIENHALDGWIASPSHFDELGRPQRLNYTDGTYETRSYACCGLASMRDRSGGETFFQYDALGRQTHVTRNEVTFRTAYDADGRVKSVTRLPAAGGTEMVQSTSAYDLAGRLTESLDAGNRSTTYAEAYNSSTGETTRTTTNPDDGTIIEVTSRDGSRLSVSGDATAPRNYEYGITSGELFTKEIMVGESGATTEWSKSFTDFAGRAYKTVLADNATTQSYFNGVGQLFKQVDPDGVVTLFGYNARGEQEVTAINRNTGDTIDYNGTDRITKTVITVAAKTVGADTFIVQRTTTRIWETASSDTATDVSVSEQTANGLHSWQTVRGLPTTSVTVLDGPDARTVTTTDPYGVKTIQVYTDGRLASTTVKTAGNAQLAKVDYGYDAQGRLTTSTDARNGTTTYAYFADDQLQSVVMPDPDGAATVYTAQTTTFDYDEAGRPDTVTHPDNGVVITEYFKTGQVKKTSGARTYTVEYAYYPQGRVKTLTTWQDASTPAVTTWNYSATRGLLLNKRYDDNSGPDYTYTDAGRLETRTWDRGVVCTYTYNDAGDLEAVDYSDSTPDVGYTFDRSGRPQTVTDASGARTLAYHVSGQLDSETYTSGALNGLSVDRTFDSLSRPGSVSALSASSVLNQIGYSYDAASRLEAITHNTHTATYAYEANSPLVAEVTFKQGGSTERLKTTKTYDKLNRLSSVVNTRNSTLSAPGSAYAYNSANQRTKATREDGSYWNYGYDALGQVTSGKKHLANANPINGLDYAWTYDDIGNRKTAVTNGQNSTYSPNELNQYSQRTVPGAVDVFGAASATATVTVTVGSGTPQATTRQGELYSKQLPVTNTSAAQNPTLTITGVKNLVGPAGEDAVTEITKTSFVAQTPETFTHDADGNLTDDARWHYTWDGENRLIAMETATAAVTAGVTKQKLEFAYDGQGRRFQKKVYAWNSGSGLWTLSSELRFVYDGWNLIAELNALSSNAVVRTYVWGLDLSGSMQDAGGVGGLLFASNQTPSSSLHAPCFDGNGNVIGYVDMATGAKLATYDYNAFGETIIADGPAATLFPFRFSTKYADTETALLYYGFRYYSPNSGRWLSRDPIAEEGGISLYAMLANDNANFTDFLGLDTFLYFWDSRQGSSGAGHVATGVGTVGNQELFEANPYPSGNSKPMRQPYRQSGSLDEVVKKSADFQDFGQKPRLILQFASCAEDDAKHISALEEWYKSHPKWELRWGNCADSAKCGLTSINIATPNEFGYSTPQELAAYLYRKYGPESGQKEVEVKVLAGDWYAYSKDNATVGVVVKSGVDPAGAKISGAFKKLNGKVEAIVKKLKK